MRLDELINTHRQDLNDTDMVIWKYILQHRELASHISIHELARECCVSSTTIVRFAQKLGLDGFGELKAVLKMEEPDQPHYNTNVIEDLKTFYLFSVKFRQGKNSIQHLRQRQRMTCSL